MPLTSFWMVSAATALVYLAIVAGATIVAAIRRGGRRDDDGGRHEALSRSRFTIPVSIVVPVGATAAGVSRAINRLLHLNYPEFEVIVVCEEISPALVETLVHDWQIEAREFFYRKTLETADVHRMYRSTREPRLLVVDKAPGGYADALNCGVNLARYRYVAPIAPDLCFDADALMRAMEAPLRDPGRVLGASSHVESGEGFERLASARSLMESRLLWRALHRSVGPHGAVSVWRRDAVLKVEGFSTRAADPAVDLMFRIQAGAGGAGHFHRGTAIFGRRVAPGSAALRRDAGVRQRGALQVVLSALRHGPRGVGGRTLAAFIQTELLVPLAQTWIAVAAVTAALLQWWSWTPALVVLLILAFGNAAVSAAALLVRGAQPDAPEEAELVRLLLLSPLEFFVRRPAFAFARLVGSRRRL